MTDEIFAVNPETCPECDDSVRLQAGVCPECGYDASKPLDPDDDGG